MVNTFRQRRAHLKVGYAELSHLCSVNIVFSIIYLGIIPIAFYKT